ncbi:hypothetical protein NSA50_18015 [Clostridium sp. DSM 100503]|uniref:hypothetical protein n=1 Tax=Clostridium sp. DSM 100503 TaxID=2963282 RepID=UPI00214A7E04|nr:hypothetical protein [Clostridium sp. DSM 100503]MCR1952901.1 hypothetical protein [Clostridium sp. DSM 100503]
MKKGLIIGAILGLGTGIVINKLLSEKSVDDIKEVVKENVHKVKDVIKENVEKAKDTIEEYNN